MTTGFAEIFDTILSNGLSKFAGEVAYKKITADSGKLAEMVTLIENDSRAVDETGYKASAEFIEKNFTADAYKEMMKTIALVVISVIALLLLLNIARKFNNGAPENKMGDISDHIIGGFFGIIEGLSIVVLMTAVVRLMIIYGSNEMILFNKECIDKTFIFKHIYNLVTSL